ncbi:MAG TPA: heme A synthase [Aliiroseovarius sp.]|nr:heme A synthase [Aliiroseovarius sp.]
MMGQRKLFEEVAEGAQEAHPAAMAGGISRQGGGGGRGGVRLWLVVLFVMVAAMVIIGGLTRLTDSGLSITEWDLVKGTLPPMNVADWLDAYTKYQASPEFQLQNNHMDLAAFKQIYWWEWGHRFLGRMIGLVWAVGFVFFWATRLIPPGWAGRLLGIGLLGGLQGAIGWWMVSSGLVGQMVDVASYRLATHLGLAFIILGLIAWYVLALGRDEAARMQARRAAEGGLKRLATLLLALAFLQILLGALVAGIDAGRSFIDWPWMAGQFFPPDAYDLRPGWRNFFENPGLVQFIHRMVAYTLTLAMLWVWWRARRSPNQATRTAFTWAAMMLLVQVALGIITVLYAAPLHAAIPHRLGAFLTWVLIISARHQAAYPVTQSIRG